MTTTNFIGDYLVRIDEKGRLVLPAAFKRQLPPAEEDVFVVKKDIFEPCLVLYTMQEWERQTAIIRANTNPYNKAHNTFLREFFKGTAEVTMDKANRLLMPKRLLDIVQIDKEVYLAGQDNKIEIWAKERYEAVGNNDDDFANLAESIFGNGIKQ